MSATYLGARIDWHKEIEQTAAKDSFVICRPDEFPLSQVQAVAERVLYPEASTFFSRKPVPRRSPAADEILIDELKALVGVLYLEEAAIVGCLHLFSWEVARWHLWKRIRPDLETANQDAIFTSRISVYLQCIIVAQKADSLLVHDGEASAARQLLRILHHGKTKEFPSVLKLLATVTDTGCEELLPFEFLAEVLRRAEWREKVRDRLNRLRGAQRWADAYNVVAGLQAFSERSDLSRDVRSWLPDLFSHYPMWASWQPNLARIQAWKAATTPEQRVQLAPVFELEGPDTTAQQRSTLRRSSSGAFPDARSHGIHNDADILDHLLDLLDRAVRIGPNAINLFIHLTLTTTLNTTSTHTLTWHPLHQLSVAFSPGQDSIPNTLLSFLHSLHPSTPIHHRTTALTTVLPLLNSSTPLQSLFGEAADLPARAPRTVSDAQSHFRHLLFHSSASALPLGLAILSLGRALLASTWLHDRWKPPFIRMLGALPSEDEIRARFKAVQAASADRQAQMDYLAVSLGASTVAGTTVTMTPPPVVIEDEVWRAELDVDRQALRRALQALKGVDSCWGLATRCLKAAVSAGTEREDAFVKGVTRFIVGGSDQACVNMARFLAPWVAGGTSRSWAPGGKECWVELCLWMMRRRPRGMLERLGADLPVASWNEWVSNLKVLFGEAHLGEEGGLGFTAERMRQLTVWKMSRVGRVHSGSSRSTLSDY
ncbi:hypothetical protein QBC34DRAFT_496065 [Podospora aff. communis PSN243]|uniref:Nuclear pore complex protein Nup85 n=1 Tax=Podospora aff. communis PSN243 TaxID=3040156 RepID=A0AAV9GHP6_9PEZI|nr:hypothetical protein QBC34DRAFT_496065 [Podospora aff. communis PSN243]